MSAVRIVLVHRDTLSVEAVCRRAPNGDLLIVCTCGDVSEPAAGNRVYCFLSSDNGATWSQKCMMHPEDGWAHYQTETAVIGNKIYAFITRHNGRFLQWENYRLVSENSGATWEYAGVLRELPADAFVRGMYILSDGSIVFPYHAYPLSAEQKAESLAENRYCFQNDIDYIENGLLVSRDGGIGFERRICFLQDVKKMRAQGLPRWSWSENTIVQVDENNVAMLLRVDGSGCLWRSDSPDCGRSWCEPYRTDIPNPANKPQLLRAANGKIVLVNTPSGGSGLDARFPLQVWISGDGMRSWYKKVTVSDFPGAYSYANGFIDANGHLLLAFEFNRHDIYFADVDLSDDL